MTSSGVEEAAICLCAFQVDVSNPGQLFFSCAILLRFSLLFGTMCDFITGWLWDLTCHTVAGVHSHG